MIKATTALAVALLALMPLSATAQPFTFKLSFFGSATGDIYVGGVKPFVDAINTEGKGLLAIQVYFNGTLGTLAEQPRLVLDGIADMAFLVPGQTAYRFPDTEVLSQPNLLLDTREGTLLYTRLIAADALRGYQDFFVIGAYAPGPNLIHSSKPIGSIADLKGQKIRSNNPIEAEVLERLGAIPTILDITKTANAIANGAIDGTTLSTMGLFDFGVWRVAPHHYLLRVGASPLTLVMNRKKFDNLPEAAKALIRKYSGDWAAAAWIEHYATGQRTLLDRLRADPQQTVVEPSPSDLAAAQRIYRSITDAWAAKDPHNRQLVTMVEAELATLRSGQ